MIKLSCERLGVRICSVNLYFWIGLSFQLKNAKQKPNENAAIGKVLLAGDYKRELMARLAGKLL